MPVDMTVDLCGLELSSPLILASGTLGEPGSLLKKLAETQPLGAVVTRSISLRSEEDRFANPSPRFVKLGKYGLLNSETQLIHSIDEWCDSQLGIAKEGGVPVIVSIEGDSTEDYVELSERLTDAGADAIEVNISCTFEARRGKGLALMDQMRDLLSSVRKAVSGIPMIVKAPLVLDYGEIAEVVQSSGADAIAALNTIGPGMVIDVDTGRPLLGFFTGSGGLSGPALKPIAIAAVNELARASDLPVIGIGGITTGKDVVEFTMAGSTGVQLLTAALLRGPNVFTQIHKQLARWLEEKGYDRLSEIRGVTNQFLGETNWVPHVAIIDEDLCNGCERCIRVCPHDALSMNAMTKVVVNEEICAGCGLCWYECPEDAITLKDFP
ncbi:MAG: 4Fe-4S binding protein [Candidatus Thorarchaeota archaeon]|jgi:dihydroorotate dehydrogenase subfamily 1